jgi:hypothetical protein
LGFLDIPGVEQGEHPAHDIEEPVLAGLTRDLSKCIVGLCGQKCTKLQIKQLLKPTEKTFIVGCVASVTACWRAGMI